MNKPVNVGLTQAELRSRAAHYRHAASQLIQDADRLMDQANAYSNKAIAFETIAEAQAAMMERGAVR